MSLNRFQFGSHLSVSDHRFPNTQSRRLRDTPWRHRIRPPIRPWLREIAAFVALLIFGISGAILALAAAGALS